MEDVTVLFLSYELYYLYMSFYVMVNKVKMNPSAAERY